MGQDFVAFQFSLTLTSEVKGKRTVRIEGLKKYRRNQSGYFSELPPETRLQAQLWLRRLTDNGRAKRGRVPHWLHALYVGQAKRLALHPPTSEWGRSMHAKRGGYAVQRRYRSEGMQPTTEATRARLADQGRPGPLPERTNMPHRPEPRTGMLRPFASVTVTGGQVVREVSPKR